MTVILSRVKDGGSPGFRDFGAEPRRLRQTVCQFQDGLPRQKGRFYNRLKLQKRQSRVTQQECRATASKERQKFGPLTVSRTDADILALLIPAIGSVFLDPAMQVIDTAIVGRLGAAPLGAVGLSNLVYFFCTVFFSFLLVVTTPRVAQAMATSNSKQASQATADAIWVGLGCGLLLGFALWAGTPWLVMKGFSADASVASLAVQHLQIRSLASPAVVLLFVVNGAFRGFRDTRTPLLAGVAQNLVNLGLDLYLVGSLGWGVRGAASAITVAQYVGVGAMLYMLSKKSMLQLSDLKTLPGPGQIGEMLKPGLPLAFCIAALMTTVVTATNLAAGLGTVTLAAHTVIKQIMDFCLGMLGTFSTVSQTLVASCLGAGSRKKARIYVVRLLQSGIGFGTVLGAALLLGSSSLPGFFTADADVVRMARSVIPFVAFAMPLAPCSTTLEGAMLGSFKVNWVGFRTVLGAMIALAVLTWTHRTGLGLLGIWAGLMTLVACNCIADGFRITRKDSPIAAVLSVDASLSFDQDDEVSEFDVSELKK